MRMLLFHNYQTCAVPLKTKQLTIRHIVASFVWGVKPLVSCVMYYVCERTKRTYRKEKGFAPVFLACKRQHGAKKE